MTDKEKKTQTEKRVDENQRFRYIGFEVFPGKPKDLFTSDADEQKFVESVKKKREKGQLLREECTLTEERISTGERIVLAVAAVVILISLFLPWYSVYNQEPQKPATEAAAVAAPDTLGIANQDVVVSDSIAVPPSDVEGGVEAVVPPTGESTQVAEHTAQAEQQGAQSSDEEIIHGLTSRVRVIRTYTRLSAIGGLFSLGSVGSYIFSSGFVLVITALLFILMTLLAIALPLLTLYLVFGSKGTPDEKALKLKKYLKLNWIPVGLFVLAMVLSFFGASYGFSDPTSVFTSLGDSYGIATFMNSLSWGVFISLAAFILLASKGIEI